MLDEWKPKLQYFMYKSFADLRCEIYFFVSVLNKTTYNYMVKVVFGLEGLWNCLKAILEHTFYRTVQINKVMIFIKMPLEKK